MLRKYETKNNFYLSVEKNGKNGLPGAKARNTMVPERAINPHQFVWFLSEDILPRSYLRITRRTKNFCVPRK